MMTILSRGLFVLLVCAVVPGLASAQRSLDGSRRALTECQAKLNASPEFLVLRHKLGSRASPDIAFSTDKATPEEAQRLQILLRDYIIPCHRFALEVAGTRLPAIVPVLEASQAKADANYERLIAGEITWGQFIRDGKAIDAELDAELSRHESDPQN
jgi:hypothetical protein